MDVGEKFEQIKSAKNLSLREAQYFADIINNYFQLGRPQEFEEYETELTQKLPQLFSFLDFNQLINLSHNYFLFCRTNNPEKNTDLHQQKINEEVFIPFWNRLNLILKNQNFTRLNYNPKPKNVILQTRHATTQGSYAPGKQIFAFSKALLLERYNVKVLSSGNIDADFKDLMLNNPCFHVSQKQGLSELEKLADLRSECQQFEPATVFTDAELGLLVAAEIIGMPAKCHLLSAGFYRVPWYSKILLTEELMTDELREDSKFHAIPQTLLMENLAPKISKNQILEARSQLKLENDFVVGAFARYEMFSESYLSFVDTYLQRTKNTKVVLAGPNAQNLAKRLLACHISNGRVKLLGKSNTAILGHLCHAFLDTFPNVTGYAALESMAKGKPVFTLDCKNLGLYSKNRLRELIFDCERELLEGLVRAQTDKAYYSQMAEASLDLVSKLGGLDQLAEAIKCIRYN